MRKIRRIPGDGRRGAKQIRGKCGKRGFALRINPRGKLLGAAARSRKECESHRDANATFVHAAGPRAARRIAQRAGGTRARLYEQRVLSPSSTFSLWRGDKISSEMPIDNDPATAGGGVGSSVARRNYPEERAVGGDVFPGANNNNNDNNNAGILIARDSRVRSEFRSNFPSLEISLDELLEAAPSPVFETTTTEIKVEKNADNVDRLKLKIVRYLGNIYRVV